MDGKTVLVTGAGKGLGRAMAIDLSERGWDLVLHYNRSGSGIDEVEKICSRNGSEVSRIGADLSGQDGIAAVYDFVGQEGIRLNGIVNNAGLSAGKGLRGTEPDQWDLVQNVDLKAPVFLTKMLLEFLANGGSVVNISSAAGIRNGISPISYEAAKAALIHVTRSMAMSLGPGIRVNAVAPGFVRTDINRHRWEDQKFISMVNSRTPLKRWGEPEEIARAVSFLLSSDASFITGETLVVDGGATLG